MYIEDIKFLGDKVFLLKNIEITSKKLEYMIEKFAYSKFYSCYKSVKDEIGAEKVQFPMINTVFYKYIFETDEVPSPQLLIELYFSFYKDLFVDNGDKICFDGKDYNKESITGRILRTYPSLVRDFHFYLLLKESKLFEKVTYSLKSDINGKDIIITHDKKEYVISLYVDTIRSRYFKEIKDTYRHDYDSNEIRVPLNLSEAKKCGDFKLYFEKHMNIVKERIVQIESTQGEKNEC